MIYRIKLKVLFFSPFSVVNVKLHTIIALVLAYPQAYYNIYIMNEYREGKMLTEVDCR
mgnify:CR=1 FL=1